MWFTCLQDDSESSNVLLVLSATWVGGGYLNGTAEAVYKYGIINCHAPIGYAMSLILGGAFFATKMRLTDSLTMLDPFQSHYGRWAGLLFCVPAVMGEIFWTAAILAALGKCCDTASVIIRVDASYFIIISGSVIFLYTSLGGLYSVTYTDAFQVTTTAILLWACVPSCVSHRAVGTLDAQYTNWIGTIASEDVTQLLDFFLMTAFGGIPWQVYFQRVLACPTVTEAKILSFMAAIGCIFLAVPPVIIGVAAKHTNFTIAGYPHSYQLNDVDSPRVLPFTIVYLTSGMTAIFGLVSIAAAVMSSADSSMLSASTMITRNVYQALIRPAATEMEVVITLRIMICALGSLSVYMALSVNSVFDLWTLCSDIVYVLLFPQLLCVFYFKETNAYGSVLAFIVGGVFRCLCGEPSMNIPVLVRLPLYDPVAGQRFPFRLLCMALGLCTLLLGSFAATTVFRRGLLPEHFDVFHCFVKRPPMSQLRVDQTTGTCMAGIDHTATAQHAVSRRGSTTDVAVTEKEVPLGISKDDHKSSLVVPFQARDDGGGGHTNRQSCLAPHKRRSDESEVHRNARLVASGFTGAIVPSSRVLETSPAEDAMAERKTLHKTSMSGGAKGGCKATHKKSVAGGSEGLTDGGVSRL
ncbi:hypothetical protein HPB51_021309 [Rhipicephalus microplus]|uniref:High-affinity choline transporter 1 n=1 Tax=Rhipicephalus microplus TaxID=6941 RepID=A0A9J6F7I2_RHIMP|nr:hypothetical protein HPB51_021309 [Rhipicephalus microplus]